MQEKEMYKTISVDFLVIGSGISGLYSALKLAKLGKVLIVSKKEINESNTNYAQGGIAAVVSENDHHKLHIKDTMEAGVKLCNKKAVEIMITEGPDRIKDLIQLGSNFDRQNDKLDLTREGAHSRRRILHARGDATGGEISDTLIKEVLKHKNIIVSENTFLIDLIKNENRIQGALLADQEEPYLVVMAKEVIIASGGCGQLFKNTSNPEVTTGDGIAAAYRAGAKVMDLEFVQFHPTTFYNPGGESFLISESLRGEGALLKNINGKRFMPSYHNQAELASRDIVARAINEEIAKTDSDYVYLDLRHLNSDYIRNRFPTIYQFLSDKSIDLTEELIPVIPAAHYTMGGIVTDLNGCSSLDSLYVCGEAACTAVHGANRLASNSLLEGLVYAHRIFLELERKKNEKTNKKVTDPNEDVLTESLEYCLALNSEKKLKKFRQEIVEEAQKIKKELQHKMTQNVGIIREERNLKFLLEWLKEKLVYLNNYLLKDKVSQYTLELKNSLQIAELIVRASLLRKESRGAHYRKDYPNLKESLNYTHQIFSSNDSEVKMNVIK